MLKNVDSDTVEGFGDEWSAFDHATSREDLKIGFDGYFSEFPWDKLPQGARGFDAGCGSGRWARMVAPRVSELHCVDASDKALEVARKNLAGFPGCSFHLASVSEMPFEDGSMDFGYSLGVLHHTPDTAGALAACARKLKPGAPFLVYLYYAFDNRPPWFRRVWQASDVLRRGVCRLPFRPRRAVTDVLAATVYLPLARGALALERAGFNVDVIPLSAYRDRSFYTMRNDALDRFGTRLEQRFTRAQIDAMMRAAGLERISFREGPPHWCAVGYRASS